MGREMYTRFWSENLKETSFGRPRHRWEDIRTNLKTQDGKAWNGFIRLRVGASGKLF
jgi:hypothetical protein